MTLYLRQFILTENLGKYMSDKSLILEVLEDPDDPESLVLQFPDQLLEKLGWKPGDVLTWNVDGDSITLSKK